MSKEMILLVMYVVGPGLIALLVVWGEWKPVLQAFAAWYGLLFLVFFVLTGGNVEHLVFGTAIYGMFFSIVAVPILALVFKLWRMFRRRARSSVTGSSPKPATSGRSVAS